MTLANDIRNYYFSNLDKLPLDKQFHFCSRLWLWSGDNRAQKNLDRVYYAWSHGEYGSVAENLRWLGLNTLSPLPTDSPLNAADLREPFFMKYSKIKRYNSVLSRINFFQSIYSQDFSDEFYKIFPCDEVIEFYRKLSVDREALKYLATYALNFLHNFAHLIERDPGILPRNLFIEIAKNDYDISDKDELQLLIYFVTHMILGESLFYRRRVKSQDYRKMITDLEKIIVSNFDSIHMDNKFEFLVCSKLVGHKSKLHDAIWDEGEKSISPNGSFIIDKYNKNPQKNRIDLILSEHRNVLAIMSQTPPAIGR